jgi:hypothetical protein
VSRRGAPPAGPGVPRCRRLASRDRLFAFPVEGPMVLLDEAQQEPGPPVPVVRPVPRRVLDGARHLVGLGDRVAATARRPEERRTLTTGATPTRGAIGGSVPRRSTSDRAECLRHAGRRARRSPPGLAPAWCTTDARRMRDGCAVVIVAEAGDGVAAAVGELRGGSGGAGSRTGRPRDRSGPRDHRERERPAGTLLGPGGPEVRERLARGKPRRGRVPGAAPRVQGQGRRRHATRRGPRPLTRGRSGRGS